MDYGSPPHSESYSAWTGSALNYRPRTTPAADRWLHDLDRVTEAPHGPRGMSSQLPVIAPPAQQVQSVVEPVTRVRGRALRRSLVINMWMAVPVGIFFGIAVGPVMVGMSESAGLNNLGFGILGNLLFACAVFQLPASLFIERHGHRKQLFLWAGTTHRLLWIAIAAAALYLPPPLAGPMLLILTFISFALGAMGGNCWTSWMADLVPPKRRGKYFGRRVRLFAASNLVSVLTVGYLLGDTPAAEQPDLLMTLAIVAALIGAIDILGFIWVADIPTRRVRRASWVQDLMLPLREPAFRWFLAYSMLMHASIGFTGMFFWKHLKALGMPPWQQVLVLQAAPMLVMVALGPIWGRLIDRYGRKLLMAISSLGSAVLTVGWLFVSADVWLLAIAVVATAHVTWVAYDQSTFNMLLRYSARQTEVVAQGSATYVATWAVSTAAAVMLSGLMAGQLADSLAPALPPGPPSGVVVFTAYTALFMVAIVLRLIALSLVPRINTPGEREPLEALRLMRTELHKYMTTRKRSGDEAATRSRSINQPRP